MIQNISYPLPKEKNYCQNITLSCWRAYIPMKCRGSLGISSSLTQSFTVRESWQFQSGPPWSKVAISNWSCLQTLTCATFGSMAKEHPQRDVWCVRSKRNSALLGSQNKQLNIFATITHLPSRAPVYWLHIQEYVGYCVWHPHFIGYFYTHKHRDR